MGFESCGHVVIGFENFQSISPVPDGERINKDCLLWPFFIVCFITGFCFHVCIQGLDIVGVETVINFHCPSDITV